MPNKYRNPFSTPPANAYLSLLNSSSSSSFCFQEWEGYILFVKYTHTHRKRGRERTGLEMVSVFQSCPILCDHRTIGQQAPLSMQFSRQEEKSGLPFPTLGDLPDPGIECMPSACPAFPALAGRFFPLSHLGSPIYTLYIYVCVHIYIYTYRKCMCIHTHTHTHIYNVYTGGVGRVALVSTH